VEFTNLGLKKVPIDVDFIKRYPKLLGGGIWAITDLEYELPTDPKAGLIQSLNMGWAETSAWPSPAAP
jgi:ATP-dependent Lon protease